MKLERYNSLCSIHRLYIKRRGFTLQSPLLVRI